MKLSIDGADETIEVWNPSFIQRTFNEQIVVRREYPYPGKIPSPDSKEPTEELPMAS